MLLGGGVEPRAFEERLQQCLGCRRRGGRRRAHARRHVARIVRSGDIARTRGGRAGARGGGRRGLCRLHADVLRPLGRVIRLRDGGRRAVFAFARGAGSRIRIAVRLREQVERIGRQLIQVARRGGRRRIVVARRRGARAGLLARALCLAEPEALVQQAPQFVARPLRLSLRGGRRRRRRRGRRGGGFDGSLDRRVVGLRAQQVRADPDDVAHVQALRLRVADRHAVHFDRRYAAQVLQQARVVGHLQQRLQARDLPGVVAQHEVIVAVPADRAARRMKHDGVAAVGADRLARVFDNGQLHVGTSFVG